jgi:cytochrome c-type biogenesis protein
MDLDLGLGGAFLGGVVSFFSPCVLPLVPPYLCFLAGLSLDQVIGTERREGAGLKVFISALAFVAGFMVVFTIMGATASAVGQLLSQYLDWLAVAAGIAIIVMGLHFLGVFRIALLYREARVHVERKPAGIVGAFVIGLAFAFGWTPCVGPVLAAILMVAGARDSMSEGAFLLGVYALGIGVPFLVAAAFAPVFLRLMQRFRSYLGMVEKVMGALLVVTGILFITGGMNDIAFWLLETFPTLGTRG